MFTPRAVWAQAFLQPLKDPPNAINWRATQSFVSCDGRTAVNTGPWFTQNHRTGGYFTTVWQRTHSRWRWVYDGGLPSPASKRQREKVRHASCGTAAPGPPIRAVARAGGNRRAAGPPDSGRGMSADGTLGWDWTVSTAGARTLRVFLWNGRRYDEVIHAVDPPPARR